MTDDEKRKFLHELIDQASVAELDSIISAIKSLPEPEKKDTGLLACPYCGSERIYRNGKTKGRNRQRYLCRDCGQTYLETTGTPAFHSYCGMEEWEMVIRDTVYNIPLDKTAEKIGVNHTTAFNMRHKILCAIEEDAKSNQVILGNDSDVCELDETFVLESYKGKKLADDFWRRPRLHGAKAASRGLSDEQVCICAGIDGSGSSIVHTVNRATPSSDELKQVFAGRLQKDTVVLADGGKGYPAMAKNCGYNLVNAKAEGCTYDLNRINGLHSYIKRTYNQKYNGVATKYLNRYNALFALAYTDKEKAIEYIYSLIKTQVGHRSVADTRTEGLLEI